MSKLVLPPGPFDAYLFDCDGTISDSMPLHYRAWNEALASFDTSFPEDLFYAWAGRSNEEIVSRLNTRNGLHLDFRLVSHKKEAAFLRQLPTVSPIPGVLFHIHDAHGRIPMAVVSGSPRASVLETLRKFDIETLFSVVIGAEDYTCGKPAPDPYLLAAERLRVSPERCLVFEDADLGIQSAKSAGMRWVRVESPTAKVK